MATCTPAVIDIGQGTWPDSAAGGVGKPPWRDIEDWPVRVRLARRQAMVETSAAFAAGGAHLEAIGRELADRAASLLGATCLIRPLEDEETNLPIALAQPRDGAQRELPELIAAEPHGLAAACSARAAEMRCAILLPELTAKCLRLWSKEAVWPALDHVSIRSMLVAPMLVDKRVVGSILVWRDLASPPLQEDDQVFVEEVARRLARAYA